MYTNVFTTESTTTTETQTPTPRRRPTSSNEVSLVGEIVNSGIEVFVATASAIRTARKAINLVETKLDEQLVNSTFDLIDVLRERSNNNDAFMQSYMSARGNSRVRAL